MDCSTLRNFAVERERMCNSFRCGSKTVCEKCPLSALSKYSERRYCQARVLEQPDRAIKIVQEWSDKNPIKTRKTVFLKMFPNASMEDNEIPTVCAGDIFGFACKYSVVTKGSISCQECWNTSIEG